MAAWELLGGLALGAIGGLGGGVLILRGSKPQQPPVDWKVDTYPMLSPELTERIIDRLLDATIPVVPLQPVDDEHATRSDAEYEPPEDDAMADWTDGLIGVEDRPDMMGVPAGTGVPWMGVPADEMGPNPYSHHDRGVDLFPGPSDEAPNLAWVEPVVLGDDEDG